MLAPWNIEALAAADSPLATKTVATSMVASYGNESPVPVRRGGAFLLPSAVERLNATGRYRRGSVAPSLGEGCGVARRPTQKYPHTFSHGDPAMSYLPVEAGMLPNRETAGRGAVASYPGELQALRLDAYRAEVIAAYRSERVEGPRRLPSGRGVRTPTPASMFVAKGEDMARINARLAKAKKQLTVRNRRSPDGQTRGTIPRFFAPPPDESNRHRQGQTDRADCGGGE